MLELKSKWFTNSLAKASMLNNDFVACENGTCLYIVSYGNLTSSGKNTYNYELKDSEGVILASGENAYLDKLTTLIQGENPKTKERKENKGENVRKAKTSAPKTNEENKSLLLTFDEAFEKSCKQIEAYKGVALKLDKYNEKDAILLTMALLKDAKIKEAQRIKDEAKKEALEALRKTLEIAKASANEELIKSIEVMIKDKESE